MVIGNNINSYTYPHVVTCRLFFFVTYKVVQPYTFFNMDVKASKGSSNTNLLTVIRVNGERARAYTPDMVQRVDMSLTLAEALSMAGVSLDRIAPLAGKNVLEAGRPLST